MDNVKEKEVNLTVNASKREDTYVYSEFGCSIPIRFNTSEGIKTMQPGKIYDENLNEIGDAVL